MSPIFPQEIESEILVRLPSKSLHRCKSVCKSWNSLIIFDESFISNFNRHAAKKSQLLFLKHPRLFPIPIHFSLAVSENQTLIEKTTLHFPNDIIGLDSEIKTIARIDLINSNSVNGVLGLIVYKGLVNGPVVDCDMYMWNVGTNETVKLPISCVTKLFNGPPMVKFYSGFGYDKTGFDYKIVRVVYLGSIRLKCEVYCLSKNCWIKVELNGGITPNTLWASEMCTFIDGFGYWGVYKSESKDGFAVLGFNFGDNKFRKITVPESCVDGREKKYQGLWEFRGELALSVLWFGEFESGFSKHYVWLFEQSGEGDDFTYSWTSLFNIDLECGPRRPVVSLISGELVLLGEDDGEHVVFDRVSRQVKSLGVCDVDHVVLYVESLVSLRRILPKESVFGSLPDEAGSSSLPEDADSGLLPDEDGSSLLPEEARGCSWSYEDEDGSSLLPEEARRCSWSYETDSSSLPKKASLPKEASNSIFGAKAGSSLLPIETRSNFWSKEANTRVFRKETRRRVLSEAGGSLLLKLKEMRRSFRSKEAGSSLLPEEARSSHWSNEAGNSLLPKEVNSGFWSEEGSSSLLPNEATSYSWSEEACSSLFPEEASGSFWSEDAGSSISPKEASSSLLPEEASDYLLVKEEASSSLLPEGASSSLLPEGASSSLLPEEASRYLLVKEEAKNSLLAEEASSSLLPEEASSKLLVNDEDNSSTFPKEASSSFLVKEEASSGLLPEEASSGLCSGEAVNRLLAEEAISSLLLDEAVNHLLAEEAISSLLLDEVVNGMLPEEASSSLLPEDASS